MLNLKVNSLHRYHAIPLTFTPTLRGRGRPACRRTGYLLFYPAPFGCGTSYFYFLCSHEHALGISTIYWSQILRKRLSENPLLCLRRSLIGHNVVAKMVPDPAVRDRLFSWAKLPFSPTHPFGFTRYREFILTNNTSFSASAEVLRQVLSARSHLTIYPGINIS